MSTEVYFLIVSIIFAAGDGGVTQMSFAGSLAHCRQEAKAVSERMLAFQALSIETACVARGQFIPASLLPVASPPPQPRPKIAEQLSAPPTPAVKPKPARTASAAKCRKRYRIVNHHRRWYCK